MLNAKQVNVKGYDANGNEIRITISNDKTDELHIHLGNCDIHCNSDDLIHAIMLLTAEPEGKHSKVIPV